MNFRGYEHLTKLSNADETVAIFPRKSVRSVRRAWQGSPGNDDRAEFLDIALDPACHSAAFDLYETELARVAAQGLETSPIFAFYDDHVLRVKLDTQDWPKGLCQDLEKLSYKLGEPHEISAPSSMAEAREQPRMMQPKGRQRP